MRVGFGYDVHQLVEGRKLILGGVTIPSSKGALGHSDADALCHAIGDALLGGAALGDIGSHFPDSEERFAGISSLLLLKEIGNLISDNGFKISNIDSTVILEQPKLMPYIQEMQRNIAESLGLVDSQVSIKATTSEKMGFVGQGEGVSVFASVLIEEDEI
ncbi:2-C-methyl-D-erythritol 2,4-cyclodiphosphate synthase [candidate division KSB1 bacterium]|nr:2-C-methyl-D-erythritol 2,4-cyclodiphosphate synthase [candidate division KSB1 bacterium]NIR70257.1 2-C-methyl-D-erythritol 2,4-cyclodiphosphate synthase [candidate division KSB1 bacterium]NIS26528.1 2-C-methyl-D-erythritol 2,4-cyclodiphosphate synthase [candidate division KSB1 bacterium]NIT73290.1 2-C-methyl-D-erythritol 2,4-cyclodiphosphate synthase [candidate division KSB1 bacterium]NIU23914.1 2-C-methyl-D-erythritol 2,4-cyclodiphosphate synthase [candidate division KSB1 bacterium]